MGDLECGECLSEDAECFYSATCGEIEGRECRICQLSLVDDDDDAFQLGCSCKNDLAAAHKHCADTWFKIKGNKTCEICNSTVSNLVEILPMPPPPPTTTTTTTHGAVMDVNLEATTTTHRSSTTRGQGCINGHRLLNFILACLVFAFVISWLFHFNIPS